MASTKRHGIKDSASTNPTRSNSMKELHPNGGFKRSSTNTSIASRSSPDWMGGHQHTEDSFSSRRMSMNRHMSRIIVNTEDFTINKLNFEQVGLCGRDEEIEKLQEVFKRRCIHGGQLEDQETAAPSIVSIMGHSGTGKSVLAQQLQKRNPSKALFGCGKFDLQQRIEPYRALADAFSELASKVLQLGEPSTIESIKTRLRETILPEDIPVITDIVPALEVLLMPKESESSNDDHHDGGNQDNSSNNAVPPQNRANRLTYAFRQLVRAISSKDHPMVLILDDVQWIDAATLKLVTSILSDSQHSNYFLLVTTCRDNEVGPDHHFMMALGGLQELHGVQTETIQLGNLAVKAVNSLLASLLRRTPEVTHSLAQIVCHKTSGNAFFVIQFLKALVDKEFLEFNYGSLEWLWNEVQIQAMEVTDNVADMLLGKLQLLPAESLFVLQVAACMGQNFDVDMLSLVLERLNSANELPYYCHHQHQLQKSASHNVKHSLKEPVASGLIDQLGPLCSFRHDSIQKAALSSIPDDNLPELQLRIGQHLTDISKDDKDCEMELFRAIDLCNLGSGLLSTTKEQTQLAAWNAQVGEAALKRAAYVPAKSYMDQGLSLLGTDPWSSNYNLAIRLYTGAAEAAYCLGDLEGMEMLVKEVIGQGGFIDNKMRPYQLLMLAMGPSKRSEEAVDVGFSVLKQLGYCKRTSKRPSILRVLVDLIKTRREISKLSPGTLAQLPEMTDQRRIQALGIMDQMMSYSFVFNLNLFAALCLKSVRWALKFGTCKYTAFSLGCYALVVGSGLGDFDNGLIAGEVSLAIANRPGAREMLPKAYLSYYGFVSHWSCDMRASLPNLMHGHQVAMKLGDNENSFVLLGLHDMMGFECAATSLFAATNDLRSHICLMNEYQQDSLKLFLMILLQAVQNLQGMDCHDNPAVLVGTVINCNEILQAGAEKEIPGVVDFINNYGMQLAYTFEDYSQAGRYRDGCQGFGEKVQLGHCTVIRHFLFRGLTSIALAARGINRHRNKREAYRTLKKLKFWQRKGNPNVVPLVLLLLAELAVLNNDKKKAEIFFKRGVLMSSRSGWIHITALVHERAGLHYESIGDPYWACHHLGMSMKCYSEWGALTKTRFMANKHGELLSKFEHSPSNSLQLQ